MTKLVKIEFAVALHQSTDLVDFESQLGDLIDDLKYEFRGKVQVLKTIVEDYAEQHAS